MRRGRDIPYEVEAHTGHLLELHFMAGAQRIKIIIGKTDCQDSDCQMEILGILQEEGD